MFPLSFLQRSVARTARDARRIHVRGTEEERFWRKVRVNYETGCWEWTANTSKGYGRFAPASDSTDWGGKKHIQAHHWSYKLFIGPIPPSPMEADHLCRNRKCTNPWHIEFVTKKVNLLRGVGLSAINARKTLCKNGHPLVGDNIAPWKSKKTCQRCRICHLNWQRKRNGVKKFYKPRKRQ